jgi:hypothetical protein
MHPMQTTRGLQSKRSTKQKEQRTCAVSECFPAVGIESAATQFVMYGVRKDAIVT